MKNFISPLFKKNNLQFTIIGFVALAVIVTTRVVGGLTQYFYVFDIAAIMCLAQSISNAKHSIFGLIFGAIGSVLILLTDIYQHIWLNAVICAINTVLFVIGAFRWKHNEKTDETKNLTRLSPKARIIVYSIYAALGIGLTFLLKYLGGTLYYLDAFYSIGCVIGAYLTSTTSIDQFIMFFVADSFGVAMYIILTIQNISNISLLMTCLIYITLGIFGLINWLKLEKEQKIAKTESLTEIKQ